MVCSEQGGTDLSIDAPSLSRRQIVVEMISDGLLLSKTMSNHTPVSQTPLLLLRCRIDAWNGALGTVRSGESRSGCLLLFFSFACTFCAHTSCTHSLLHSKLWYWQWHYFSFHLLCITRTQHGTWLWGVFNLPLKNSAINPTAGECSCTNWQGGMLS